MAIEKDPLTLLTDTFQSVLQNCAPVKVAMGLARKNVIAFNKSRAGEQKDVVSESDVPEIAIEMAGGPTNINMASSICQMDVTFNLTINSGDQRVTAAMYPVLWACYSVLAAGLVSGPIEALTWKDWAFVKKYDVNNVTAGQSNPVVNRGIRGWTAIMSVNFKLIFRKSDIVAFAQGT